MIKIKREVIETFHYKFRRCGVTKDYYKEVTTVYKGKEVFFSREVYFFRDEDLRERVFITEEDFKEDVSKLQELKYPTYKREKIIGIGF